MTLPDPPHFDLSTAQQYARAGQLETWLHAYLNQDDNPNPGLSEGLKRQRRWWLGPVELLLSALTRCCGPEPAMEFVVPRAHWEVRITHIANSLHDLADLPPLLAEYRAGILSIRDGNHRYGALTLREFSTCWAVIWFNTQADFEQYLLKEHMMREVIATTNAPAAVGAYSQAIKANGTMVYVSGQLGMIPETKAFAGNTVAAQTEQALKNMAAILKAAGTDMAYVVKCTVLLADINSFGEMNTVYSTFFPSNPPARAAFAVRDLPLGALVEIEAFAVMPE